MTTGLGLASVGGATLAAAQVGEFPSYHWCPGDVWRPEWWECPLHGSRFAPDGTLLEGPATRNLNAAQ
jgi:hypothetical protein